MALSRYYIKSFKQGENQLTGTQAHHLSVVMRIKPGSIVEVFDGKGQLGTAYVSEVTKRFVLLDVTETSFVKPRMRGKVILAMSPPKGNRWDWLVSKTIEIGADQILPVLFERSVRQGNAKNFVERNTALAVATAKQCKRLYLPKISEPIKLNELLDKVNKDLTSTRLLVMSLSSQAVSINKVDLNWDKEDAMVFVGPEGGFTAEEEQKIVDSYGAMPVKLTQNVLRTETAALSAAAILCCKRDSCE